MPDVLETPGQRAAPTPSALDWQHLRRQLLQLARRSAQDFAAAAAGSGLPPGGAAGGARSSRASWATHGARGHPTALQIFALPVAGQERRHDARAAQQGAAGDFGALYILAVVSGFDALVDPSAQAHYPVTPVCTDFNYADMPHSPGGSYVTSWGKRRFSRYSENQTGLVIWWPLAGVRHDRRHPRTGTRAGKQRGRKLFTTNTGAFWGILLGAMIAVFGQVIGGQLGASLDGRGQGAYDTVEANSTLGRDQACVLMALGVGVRRQRAQRVGRGKLSKICGWWGRGTIFIW